MPRSQRKRKQAVSVRDPPRYQRKRKQGVKLRGSEGTVVMTTHCHLDAKPEKYAIYQSFVLHKPLRALLQNLNEVQSWPQNKDDALPHEEYRTEQRERMMKRINRHLT